MSDPFDLSGAEPQPGPEPGAVSLSQPGAPASPFLDALNTEQREAAATLDGALLVLAGAGTGKTRVLVSRLAHILAAGRAFPGQILAVTFGGPDRRRCPGAVARHLSCYLRAHPAPPRGTGGAQAQFHHPGYR
jgi:DNA helicase-2/ATP-dependent DNA helicase PcrA